MEAIFAYIGAHFQESLIMFLIVSLFFKETIVAVFRKWAGLSPTEDQRRTLQMANTMEGLKMHFNDETTHLLTDIQVMLAKSEEDHQKMGDTNIQQCVKLDEIRDTLRDMQRNGIRIRR